MLVFYAIIPIAAVALLGFVLSKSHYLKPSFFDQLALLVFKLLVPAFLFSNVYRSGLQDISSSLIAYFVPVLIIFVLVVLLFNHRLALVSTFSNNVLVGIPVLVAILGEQGLTISLSIISMHGLILFSAFYLFSTKQNVTPSIFKAALSVFSNPVIIALLLGVSFNLFGIELPNIVLEPIVMLADTALPLALIILGSSLAKIKKIKPELLARVAIFCLIKLIVLPLTVFLFAYWVMALDKTALLCLVVLASCPTGISVMPFVEPVKIDRELAHSCIAVSTFLSIFMIPLNIWLLQ